MSRNILFLTRKSQVGDVGKIAAAECGQGQQAVAIPKGSVVSLCNRDRVRVIGVEPNFMRAPFLAARCKSWTENEETISGA
jgi:hypothetical protein